MYYEWDLDGDGDFELAGNSDKAAVHKTYSQPGVRNIVLRVSDFPDLPGGEGVATVRRRYRIRTAEQYHRDREPVARLAMEPNPVLLGGTARFDGSGSSDPDGDHLFYEWSPREDGGRSLLSEEPVFRRTYTELGERRLLLRVFDEYGKYTDVGQTFNVVQGPADPVAALDITPNPVLVNDTVTFSAARSTDLNNDIQTYRWDLDGEPGYEVETSGARATRIYGNPGTYKVGLLVIDQSGRSSTATGSLQVDPRDAGPGTAPTAVLGIDPNPAQTNRDVQFTATGSSDPDHDITTYDWDLDGVEGYEDTGDDFPYRTHRFATPGTYTVGLRVHDASGHVGTTSRTLQVHETSNGVALRPAGFAPMGARKPRLGRARPFSARLTADAGRLDGGAVSGSGRLRVSLGGPPRLTKAERLLKRFLSARWRTKLGVSVDTATGTATIAGLALATPRRGRDRACLRLRVDLRAGAIPRGTFEVTGGTGVGARLRGQGAFRVRATGTGPALTIGSLRTGQGRRQPLPRGCGLKR
jgi:PKD repeat protein